MSKNIEFIKIKNILQGFYDGGEEGGVSGMNGKLNIRPTYQREYIHENNEIFKEELIQSVFRHRPIGLIYFAVKNDYYELMDGQQRILTICKYYKEEFFARLPINSDKGERVKYNHLKKRNQHGKILEYEIMVYKFKGNDDEKLRWFKTINKEVEVLSPQEIRNSLHQSDWLNDAKRYFTYEGQKNRVDECVELMGNTNKRERKRQGHLERIIQWKILDDGEDSIREFMATESEKPNAIELWEYFKKIYEWQDGLFGEEPKKGLKHGLNWGKLYNTYKNVDYSNCDTKSRFNELYEIYKNQEDPIENTEYPFVQLPKGLYQYILEGEAIESRRYINKRFFTENDKRKKWKEQNKKCAHCSTEIEFNKDHGDHKVPHVKGGRTIWTNLQVLCIDCNRSKSDK